MGFMDKAKKLAEQAQQKLDEAQTQFNQAASPDGGQAAGGGVQYDEHGRPIQQAPSNAPPSAAPPAPTATGPDSPPAPAPEGPPAPVPAAQAPTSEQPEVAEQPQVTEQPPSEIGDSNANPDPFKPL